MFLVFLISKQFLSVWKNEPDQEMRNSLDAEIHWDFVEL